MTRDNLGRYTTTTKYIFNKVGRTLVLLMANPYFVCVLLGATIVAGIVAFDQRYQLQSPVIIRLPYHSRPLELINSIDDFEVILSPTKEQVYIDREEMTIDQKICQMWGQSECMNAIKVMTCESGGNPRAIVVEPNGSMSAGLFQINSVHWTKDVGASELLTIDTNLEVAKDLWDRQGWNPWTCSSVLSLSD